MRQHIDVGVGIVMQRPLADRRFVAEAFRDKLRIAQQAESFSAICGSACASGPEVSSA